MSDKKPRRGWACRCGKFHRSGPPARIKQIRDPYERFQVGRSWFAFHQPGPCIRLVLP